MMMTNSNKAELPSKDPERALITNDNTSGLSTEDAELAVTTNDNDKTDISGEDAEIAFKREELAFRREQFALEHLKWEQQKKSPFRRWFLQWIDSPTRATVSVALLTLAGSLVALFLQIRSNSELERQKFESQMVLDAISKAPSNDAAALRLQFLLEVGILEDRSGKIRQALKRPSTISVFVGGDGPETPAFNVRPLSATPRLNHDLPMIDAFVLGASGRRGRFSQTDVERTSGVEVQAGDTVLVSIYVHNAASPKSEYATAGDVRIGAVLPDQPGTRHIVGAGVTGDNTRAAYTSDAGRGGNARLWAIEPVRLRLVPNTTIACLGTRTFDERKFVVVSGREPPFCGYGFAEIAVTGTIPEALMLGRIRGSESVFVSFLMSVEPQS